MDIQAILAQYGYVAIFVLLTAGIILPLIPDESILVLAGILIHRGTLRPELALAAGFGGSVCGITGSYLIGRAGVQAILNRIGAHHMEKVDAFFARYGRWTLFFGYFVVGLRHVTAIAAGTSRVPPRTFALFAYSGGFLWVATFLAIGYFVGDGWERYARYVHGGALGVVAAVAAAAVLVWVFNRRKGLS